MKHEKLVLLFSAAATLALTGMSVGTGQIRILLADRTTVPNPQDGDIAADFGAKQLYLNLHGGWRSLRSAASAPDVAARLPDYQSDSQGNLTVAAGAVVMLDGESFQNSASMVYRAPVTTPATQQYVSWKALFAVPAASGTGFSVVASSNFSAPDSLPTGVPTSVLTNLQYRYLGSVPTGAGDGQIAKMRKSENHFYYHEAASILKDTSGSVQSSQIQNVSPKALAVSVVLEFSGPGSLNGPHGELYGKFPTALTDPAHLQFELPVQAGSFTLLGVLPDCDHDQADQYLIGHVEDPALFLN